MKESHKKHAKLARPLKGRWGRHEVAFLGTHCSEIQKLAGEIATGLSPRYQLSFYDATHEEENLPAPLMNGFAHLSLQKKNFYEHQVSSVGNEQIAKALSSDIDLAIVNGNHFEAQNQMLIINPEKASSVRKRQKQLTHVLGLITHDSEEMPSFVEECLPNANSLPKFKTSEINPMIDFMEGFILSNLPKVQGLILAGGGSTRMGEDKVFLNYHGKEHHLYIEDILRNICEDVHVSCQPSHEQRFKNPLPDTFTKLGPMGGILSAFRHDPNAAWLTVACDCPLLNRETLEFLLKNRDASKMATCFFNSETDLPEPLITIWEPRAYAHLLRHISEGYSCPRRALLQGDVNIVRLKDETPLKNVNTPQEYESVMEKIGASEQYALP